MGSYLVYPRTASPLRYHTRHHRTLLIRLICLYFAFHVAAVSSFTTLISLIHLTSVRLVIEHCPRSHTQTFKEGFMCLTGNLGFGFPSASFRSKLYLSSFTTLLSRLGFILVRADVYYVNRKLKKKSKYFSKDSIYVIVMFSLGDRISRFYSWSIRQFAMQILTSCVSMSNVRACTVDTDIGYANA